MNKKELCNEIEGYVSEQFIFVEEHIKKKIVFSSKGMLYLYAEDIFVHMQPLSIYKVEEAELSCNDRLKISRLVYRGVITEEMLNLYARFIESRKIIDWIRNINVFSQAMKQNYNIIRKYINVLPTGEILLTVEFK